VIALAAGEVGHQRAGRRNAHAGTRAAHRSAFVAHQHAAAFGDGVRFS
jgi:hypothetical protein